MNDNAFPEIKRTQITNDDREMCREVILESTGGLTKRELFAAMAMQGLISTITIGREEYAKLLAETAVSYADALIEELEK